MVSDRRLKQLLIVRMTAVAIAIAVFALIAFLYVWNPQRLGLAHVAHRDPWWSDSLAAYPIWVVLSVLLVGGFALAMVFSAILDHADPRHRAKLQFVLTTVFRIIVFSPLILLDRGHWLTWTACVIAMAVISAGRVYLSCYRGRLWLPWCLGVIGLAVAAIIGDATVQAAQHGSSIVSGLLACAIGTLFGGFCFGYLAARWRVASAAPRAEARQTS